MQYTPFTIQEMPAALLHPEYPAWDCYNVRDSRNVCRAQVGEIDRATEGMNRETAVLFAASPDLLAALTDLVGAVQKARTMRAPAGHYDEDIYYNGIDLYAQIENAMDAIAKAKG
mgnify:CR=1 FL=1